MNVTVGKTDVPAPTVPPCGANVKTGFGIVAPLAGDTRQPSWRFLALLGLIGGAPTFSYALPNLGDGSMGVAYGIDATTGYAYIQGTVAASSAIGAGSNVLGTAGTDRFNPALRWSVLITVGAVVFFSAYRLVGPGRAASVRSGTLPLLNLSSPLKAS